MVVYIYDGSFEGLLTSIYEAYYTDLKPDKIVPIRDHEENFLYENIYIHTNHEKFKKVYRSIQNKISERALENVYNAYLSEINGSSTFIYEYLRFGYKIGKEIDLHLADSRVMNVHKAAIKVTNEIHCFMGLLRFKKVHGDVYYASLEPDHNIISSLAPHFKDRLSDQNWIIHDLKRGLAVIYNKKSWVLEHLYSKNSEPFNESNVREIDMDFENLWKLYFKSISIESRKNLKLQKQHMPSRYWYHLTEKKL